MDEPSRPDEPSSRRPELQFLSELAHVVAARTELQSVLDWIVQKTTLLLRADAGSIKLLGPGAGMPIARTQASTKKSAQLESGSWPREFTINVMGHLMLHPEPLVSPDLTNDARFTSLRGNSAPIRAALAVPLLVENRVTGLLAVTQSTPGRRWTDDEAALMSIVGSSSAGVIEQARLRIEAHEKQRLEQEQKRLQRELDLAREIQMSLVPAEALRVGPWEAYGRVVPARQIGGDAFDFFPLADGRLAVAIADVSGKGVPAAILMSNVQAKIRSYCTGHVPPADAIAGVNRSVAARVPAGKFITLFYAELDAAGRLRYCGAGHNPPLLRRADGTIEVLSDGGFPLGLFEDAVYAGGEATLAPGDSLLLYSDGVCEALDTLDREFGDERLRAWWSACPDRCPSRAVGALLAELERFRGSAAQSDDMTAVVVSAAAP